MNRQKKEYTKKIDTARDVITGYISKKPEGVELESWLDAQRENVIKYAQLLDEFARFKGFEDFQHMDMYETYCIKESRMIKLMNEFA